MKVDVINTSGKKVDSISLPKEIFGMDVNDVLMMQAVRVYLARQRQGTKKIKSRGEVKFTTAKVWRQKGTGRARHGSRRAPIFVGGGQAHGPTGEENYKLKLPKKMKRMVLFGSLSRKVKDESITIVDGLDKIKPKTKIAFEILKKTVSYKDGDRVLVVLSKRMDNVWYSMRNLPLITLTQVQRINFYEVLKHNKVILSPETINLIKETFLLKGEEKAKVKEKNQKEVKGKKEGIEK